ncbi:16479_t:CDS:1, partial [Funneliformis mosseae]
MVISRLDLNNLVYILHEIALDLVDKLSAWLWSLHFTMLSPKSCGFLKMKRDG